MSDRQSAPGEPFTTRESGDPSLLESIGLENTHLAVLDGPLVSESRGRLAPTRRTQGESVHASYSYPTIPTENPDERPRADDEIDDPTVPASAPIVGDPPLVRSSRRAARNAAPPRYPQPNGNGETLP